MAGRVYTTSIDNVAIGTAVQDIFSIKAPAVNNGVVIHWIHLESTNTAAAALRMRLKRLPATVTAGSGGSAPTVVALSSANQGNAQSVGRINDTTQATTGGTAATLATFNWDTVLPFDYLPAPEDRPDCKPAEELVLDLPATITATTISGFIVWEEVP